MTTTRFMSHNLVVPSCMTKLLFVWTRLHLQQNVTKQLIIIVNGLYMVYKKKSIYKSSIQKLELAVSHSEA